VLGTFAGDIWNLIDPPNHRRALAAFWDGCLLAVK